MRAQLEHPQRLLTVTVAAVAAILIGSELFALLDTALTATPSAPLRNESRVSSDPVITITEAGLFGAAATPIVQSDDAGLPQTSAQLVLRGVFTGNTPEQGSAIFELPDGSTRMIRTGNSLDGNVVLERVYAGRVVLNRGGLQENLAFPSAQEYADAIAEAAAPITAASEPASSAAPATLTEDEKRANILRRLEELRSRSLERNQG